MKHTKFLIFALVVGIISFLIINSRFLVIENVFYQSPCDTPITYKIGSIDERFGLPRSEAVSATKQASDIWNTTLGKQLFIYDSGATLTINMVYDRRQLLNTQINLLEKDIKSGKTTLKDEIANFERHSAEFNNKLTAFKQKVISWNAKGGGPQEEYDKLIQEQQSLNEEETLLRGIAQRLNLSTSQYNTQVDELNRTIRSFRNALQVSPEEGVYNPQEERIDIFFNNNRNELIRTIAHEFGHARGLSHSTNQQAIMYPSTTQFLTPTADEIAALRKICRKRPFYEPLFETFSLYLYRFGKTL
ncbi:MAG: Matrixin family protein [Candidatus Levybacteria bacterium GW2011_GWB1_35_5]|nr:MAG: Matrixin family protein [Candidatus Levybacteria bacterium GW2011_GWB1_35_5]